MQGEVAVHTALPAAGRVKAVVEARLRQPIALAASNPVPGSMAAVPRPVGTQTEEAAETTGTLGRALARSPESQGMTIVVEARLRQLIAGAATSRQRRRSIKILEEDTGERSDRWQPQAPTWNCAL